MERMSAEKLGKKTEKLCWLLVGILALCTRASDVYRWKTNSFSGSIESLTANQLMSDNGQEHGVAYVLNIQDVLIAEVFGPRVISPLDAFKLFFERSKIKKSRQYFQDELKTLILCKFTFEENRENAYGKIEDCPLLTESRFVFFICWNINLIMKQMAVLEISSPEIYFKEAIIQKDLCFLKEGVDMPYSKSIVFENCSFSAKLDMSGMLSTEASALISCRIVGGITEKTIKFPSNLQVLELIDNECLEISDEVLKDLKNLKIFNYSESSCEYFHHMERENKEVVEDIEDVIKRWSESSLLPVLRTPVSGSLNISLGGCFSGCFCRDLIKVEKLKNLRLEGLSLLDKIYEKFGCMPNLQYADLHFNNISNINKLDSNKVNNINEWQKYWIEFVKELPTLINLSDMAIQCIDPLIGEILLVELEKSSSFWCYYHGNGSYFIIRRRTSTFKEWMGAKFNETFNRLRSTVGY